MKIRPNKPMKILMVAGAMLLALRLHGGEGRPLPVVPAPFESISEGRTDARLLNWMYRTWAFEKANVWHHWAEFACGNRGVMLEGTDERLNKLGGGKWRGSVTGFGRIGVYAGKVSADRAGDSLLAAVFLTCPGEKPGSVADSTNDVLTVDRAKNRIAWTRRSGGKAYSYGATPAGPGRVRIVYDAGLAAEVRDLDLAKFGVTVDHRPPKDGGRGEILIDLGETPLPRVAPKPVVNGVDFWATDALDVPLKPTRNLLQNPGFEQGLKAWCDTHQPLPWSWFVEKAHGQPLVTLTNETHTGRHALCYRSLWTGWADEPIFSAPVALEPGKTYTLSWWAKGSPCAALAVSVGVPDLTSKLSTYKKVPSQTQFAANVGKEWQRFGFSFVPSGPGAVVHLRSWGRCTVLIDDLQLEEGDAATDYDPEPAVAALRTSDRFNFIPVGRPIDAKLELSGRPSLSGTLRVRVRDFYSETLLDRTLPFALDERGRADLPVDFDGAVRDTGVFYVCYDFEAAGKTWRDYARFTVVDPLRAVHPLAQLFGIFDFWRNTGLAPQILDRVVALGWGAETHVNTKGLTDVGGLAAKGKVKPIIHLVRNDIAAYARENKKNLPWDGNATNAAPEMLSVIEEGAYQAALKCRDDDTWWAYTNEEESSPIFRRPGGYDIWVQFLKAARDGLARGFRERGLKFRFGPTHGPTGGTDGKLKHLGRYIEAARKIGLEFDFLGVHQSWALDGASFGSWQDRETLSDALEKLMDDNGMQGKPYAYGETFYMLQEYLPAWGALDWCDAYAGTIPTYALGNREFVHAGLLARMFVMDLKRWPRLVLSHPWMSRLYFDREMTPSTWSFVANTLGHLLPDPRFYGEARPFSRIRGYVFRPTPDRTDGVLALWAVYHYMERGAGRGPVLRLRLPADAEFRDLMGARRTAKPDAEGLTPVPLTCAPLFISSADPAVLLTAVKEAKCPALENEKVDSKKWKAPQTAVAVRRLEKDPDWSTVPTAPGIPALKAAWTADHLHLRLETDNGDTVRIGFDGLGNARLVELDELGPDDSVYDFNRDKVRRILATSTQYADQSTNYPRDDEVERDFIRTFTPKGKGGVWTFKISRRFLSPIRLEPSSAAGFGFAFSNAPEPPEIGKPSGWLLLNLK